MHYVWLFLNTFLVKQFNYIFVYIFTVIRHITFNPLYYKPKILSNIFTTYIIMLLIIFIVISNSIVF